MVELATDNKMLRVSVKRGDATYNLSFPSSMSQTQIKSAIDSRFPYQQEAIRPTTPSILESVAQSPVNALKGASAAVVNLGATTVAGLTKMYGEKIEEMSDSHKTAWQLLTSRENAFIAHNEFSALLAIGNRELKGAVDEQLKDVSAKLLENTDRMTKALGITRPGDTLGDISYDIGGAFGSVAFSVGLSMLGGSSAAIGAIWGAISSAGTYLESRAAGHKPEEARYIANLNGTFQGAVSAIGIHFFKAKMDTVEPIKRSLIRIGNEVAEEVLQFVGESAIANLSGMRHDTRETFAKDLAYTAVLATVASAPISAGYTYMEHKGQVQMLRDIGVPEKEIKPTMEKMLQVAKDRSTEPAKKVIDIVSQEVLNSPEATNMRQQNLEQTKGEMYGEPIARPLGEYDGLSDTDIEGENISETEATEYEKLTGERPSGLPKLSEIKTAIFEGINKIITPISTRLKKIAPEIHDRVKRFAFDSRRKAGEQMFRLSNFYKSLDTLTPKVRNELLFALTNSDVDYAYQLADKHGVDRKVLQDVRDVLNAIYEEAVAAKILKGEQYTENYFPRQLRYDSYKAAMKYFNELFGEDGNIFEQAINKAEEKLREKGKLGADEKLNDTDRARLFNHWLLQVKPEIDGVSLDLPTAARKRIIKNLDAYAYENFFESTDKAIKHYIYDMNEAIEKQKLFYGDSSIGGIIDTLITSGDLDVESAEVARQLINAYMSKRGVSRLASLYRDAEYIALLAHVSPILSQLQDSVWALNDFGFADTLNAFYDTVKGEGLLDPELIGIRATGEEIFHRDGVSRTLHKLLQDTGFTTLDLIGKQTYAEAYLKNLLKLSDEEVMNELLPLLGSEDAVNDSMAALREGVITEDMGFAAYVKLSDIAPIDAMEAPAWAMKGGAYKMAFWLKSYAFKAFDNVRKRSFELMASGDTAKFNEGARNLFKLMILATLTGFPKQFVKALMRKGEMTLEDFPGAIADSILGLTMLNRYAIVHGSTDPGLFAASLFLPSFAIIGAGLKDLNQAVSQLDKAFRGETKPDEIKQLDNMLKLLPAFGDIYQFVKGQDTLRKKNEKEAEAKRKGKKLKYKAGHTKSIGLVNLGAELLQHKTKKSRKKKITI